MKKSTELIVKKLNQRFKELKAENLILEDYNIITKFASYPYDTKEPDEIYNMLIDRINQNFNQIQLCKSPLEEAN